MFAEVDEVARGIAILGLVAAFGKILWDITAYWLQGRQALTCDVWAEDEPRTLLVKVVNKGRRPVFVQRGVLCYQLGGQDLSINLNKANQPDQDRRLEAYGDSEVFRWVLDAEHIMQFHLGFQEDPDCLYISVRSQAGEVCRIPNEQFQGIIRHLLNEFDPPVV
jgi:hypothetical protein